MGTMEFEKTAMRVSIISLIGNALLSVFKLLAGLLASSSAMISDAVHSASDVFSTIVVIIGIKYSSEEADDDHPYGHERMECVSALVLSFVLMGIGLVIGYKGVLNIIYPTDGISIPGTLALVASIVSIVSKELMYQYTAHYAKRINSTALMADAWHHRSDSLSSIGALIGIFLARRGFKLGDPIASVVISGFIIKAAYDIFKDAIDKMVDHSAPHEDEDKIREIILSVDGVKRIDLIRTRMFGSRMYADLEIAVDGDLSLSEAHEIAERVHDLIEKEIVNVKHIMVHVNPYN